MRSESNLYASSAQAIVKIIVWPMAVIGLDPLEKSRFYGAKFRMLVCQLTMAYGMYSTLLFSYHSFGDFYSFVVPVAYFACAVLVFTNVIIMHRRAAEIRHLLTQIGANIFEYPDESYFRAIYNGWLCEKNYTKLRNLIFLLEIFGFIFAGTSPFIGYIFIGQMRTFIYPGWVSWQVDTPLKYAVTYCLQALVASTVFWVYYTTQIYISFVLVEFLRQYKKLEVALTSLHDRTVDSVWMRFTKERAGLAVNSDAASYLKSSNTYKTLYDGILRSNLIWCIKHHQQLLRVFEIFKSWYVLFYSMELAVSVLSFSLLFYCLVEANDYERYSSIIGVTALLVSNVFTRCYVGERFAELNGNISRSLFYNTNWHKQVLENRQLIVLFHLLTTRPLTLSGFGLFNASYWTFTSITRISYSYFNLIRASLRKQIK